MSWPQCMEYACYMRSFGLICFPYQLESMKTSSMESVSSRVFDKSKEHYLRSKDKAGKSVNEFSVPILDCFIDTVAAVL